MRPAVEEDYLTLAQFNTGIAKETEDKDLDQERIKTGCLNLFKFPQYGKYFVAVNNEGKLLGCIMNTYEVSPRLGGIVYWI